MGTCHLKVHVAEEILKPLNVNHRNKTVTLGNKAA
jgi:hypothetical protein